MTGLPTTGSTVYVRLWSKIDANCVFNDYTYTAVTVGAAAQITGPTPGSTLTSSTTTFAWNTGTGVSQYRLCVGSTVGGTQFYDQVVGTNLSATVSGLPTNGSIVYVGIWSKIGANWVYNDCSYIAMTVASPTPAQMTSPTPGSTLTSAAANFVWNTGTGVSQYWLYVGTTRGGNQLYDQDRGANRSATVTGLPTNGSKFLSGSGQGSGQIGPTSTTST